MAPDSRTRMVRTMGRLMQRQGFHATGLNQVVADSGAPKGSMYHHFPAGKEQLAAEAVRSSGAFLGRVIEVTLASKRSSAAAACRAVIDGMAASLEASGYEYGCPIATVALETASDSEMVREACAEVFANWEQLFTNRLVADGIDARRAATIATTVLALLEGGLLLARTRQHTAPLRAVGRAVDRLLR